MKNINNELLIKLYNEIIKENNEFGYKASKKEVIRDMFNRLTPQQKGNIIVEVKNKNKSIKIFDNLYNVLGEFLDIALKENLFILNSKEEKEVYNYIISSKTNEIEKALKSGWAEICKIRGIVFRARDELGFNNIVNRNQCLNIANMLRNLEF